MYAGPKRPPLSASALRPEDPAVTAEFRRQMHLAREEDAAMAAYEDTAEFAHSGPRDEEAFERARTRMEVEGDANALFHDRYLPREI